MSAFKDLLSKAWGPFIGKDGNDGISNYLGYTEYAGTPVGNLTPTHIGHEVFDTVNLDFWKATGLTDTDWAVVAFPDLSAAEINILDGALVANSGASVAAMLDAGGDLRTASNVGAAGTNVTAAEYGDGFHHITVLTLAAAALTPTIPADAEGAGAIIYTFPVGVYVGKSCHMDITAGTMDSATNAADLGLGSLIASGDIATLTTAAMEDWLTGQTVADVSSFVDESSSVMTAGQPLLFEAAGSHVLNINVAGTWNATIATADVTGTVTFSWDFLGA